MHNASSTSKENAKMPLSTWFFFRLLVPICPILIQYALMAFQMYKPAFPQISYITMLFSLSLATLTEYQSISSIVYGSLTPAIAGIFLYTIALLANKPEQQTSIYLVGFYLWLTLVVINSIRVLLSWLKAIASRANGEPK